MDLQICLADITITQPEQSSPSFTYELVADGNALEMQNELS